MKRGRREGERETCKKKGKDEGRGKKGRGNGEEEREGREMEREGIREERTNRCFDVT